MLSQDPILVLYNFACIALAYKFMLLMFSTVSYNFQTWDHKPHQQKIVSTLVIIDSELLINTLKIFLDVNHNGGASWLSSLVGHLMKFVGLDWKIPINLPANRLRHSFKNFRNCLEKTFIEQGGYINIPRIQWLCNYKVIEDDTIIYLCARKVPI